MGPADLSDLLAPLLSRLPRHPSVLVGPETSDDAGVYAFGDTALVVTADFITPICDAPDRFGRIAAANALSDVFAMGGAPLFALNLACFPEDAAPTSVFTAILEGALDKLQEAGAVLLGGHSVRDAELKFGLAVVGRVEPELLLTNAGARSGDQLVLTKPLGTGTIANGFRKGVIDAADFEPAVAGMERLNLEAARLAARHGARACTDITGYGLAGHALEIARASAVGVRLRVEALPVYACFEEMVRAGVNTRGMLANRGAFEPMVRDRCRMSERDWQLLCDPQTSGGLLIATRQSEVTDLLKALQDSGHHAALVGEALDGPARLEVR